MHFGDYTCDSAWCGRDYCCSKNDTTDGRHNDIASITCTSGPFLFNSVLEKEENMGLHLGHVEAILLTYAISHMHVKIY